MTRPLAAALAHLLRWPDRCARSENERLAERTANPITSAEIEAIIDRVGRDAVFARARSAGWLPGQPAPLWVWKQICEEIARQQTAAGAAEAQSHRALH